MGVYQFWRLISEPDSKKRSGQWAMLKVYTVSGMLPIGS